MIPGGVADKVTSPVAAGFREFQVIAGRFYLKLIPVNSSKVAGVRAVLKKGAAVSHWTVTVPVWLSFPCASVNVYAIVDDLPRRSV